MVGCRARPDGPPDEGSMRFRQSPLVSSLGLPLLPAMRQHAALPLRRLGQLDSIEETEMLHQ